MPAVPIAAPVPPHRMLTHNRRRRHHPWWCPPRPVPRTPTTAAAAADEGDEKKTGDDAADRDSNILVVLEPVEDLVAELGALADAVMALAATLARGAVEEVLWKGVALGISEHWALTSERAALIGARSCLVVCVLGSHERLALLIARGTLSLRKVSYAVQRV